MVIMCDFISNHWHVIFIIIMGVLGLVCLAGILVLIDKSDLDVIEKE